MSNSNKTPQAVLDHKADQPNANKGTPGTNKRYDKVHGNRGKIKNPNWIGSSKKK